MKRTNKRQRFYIVFTFALIGCLVLFAAYFTHANGNKKLAFYYIENDVLELPLDVPSMGTLKDDYYLLELAVNMNHYKANYIVIETEMDNNNDVIMNFVGYDSDWAPVVSVENYKLKNGLNEIRIDTQDFSYIGIAVYGAREVVIKKISFKEAINNTAQRDVRFVIIGSILIIVFSVILYSVTEKVYRKAEMA